jgi:DNA-directed RNA polymerase specialized sigma24 family protein
MTYNVTAKRWKFGWELHIDGIGVTQCRSLARAKDAAREYIALALDIDDEKTIDVSVTPDIGGGLMAKVAAAREESRRAELAQRRAAGQQRAVAKALKEEGLSGGEVAAVLGVSPQRVSQLTGRATRRT